MTFWAKQSDNNAKLVDVQITYGIITVKVTDEPGHMRYFWRELGEVLDKIEQEQKAEA